MSQNKRVLNVKLVDGDDPNLGTVYTALLRAVQKAPDPMAAIVVSGFVAVIIQILDLPSSNKNQLSVMESALANDNLEMMIYNLKTSGNRKKTSA